jgi:hypothetical protein
MNKKSFYPTNQQRKDHFPGLQEKFIGRDALRDLILEELAGRLDDGFDLNRGLYIADYQFYCPPLEDARDIVFGSKIKPMRRNMTRPGKERFDCDDFSLLLPTPPIVKRNIATPRTASALPGACCPILFLTPSIGW